MNVARIVGGGMGVVVAAVVVACGGSSGGGGGAQTPGAGACAKPQGAYVVTTDVIEGNCGIPAHSQELVVMSQGPKAGCRVVDERSASGPSGCRYEETQVCDRSGLQVTATVALDVPAGASELRGTVVYQFKSAREQCLSRYAIRYVKNAP